MDVELPDGQLHRLRDGRLRRLQSAMHSHDVEALLLFSEPNVRYATGASAMPIWSMSTFPRCAVVPQAGMPILFEHGNSVHRSTRHAADVRPMHTWEFFDDPQAQAEIWAGETAAALEDMGIGTTELAVDRMGTPAFLALARRGFRFRDSAPITQEARRVKTLEELALFDRNAPVVMEMLAACEGALSPGISEREILATMAATLLRGGGEYLATNTVCSGPNTNPWRAEATARRLEAGDLVFVDTDAVTAGGCFFCVSRTFSVDGAMPTTAQRDAYRAAHDWLLGMRRLVRPGLTCGELAARAPVVPKRYRAQRYECMIHGVGLEEENPSVCDPIDVQPNPDTVLEDGMVLVVELYAGEVGAPDGVKLGDQVVVTTEGCRVLVPYPFCERLLS